MGVGSYSLSEESAIEVALGVNAVLGCDDVDGGGGLDVRLVLAGYDGGPAIIKVNHKSLC